MVTDLQMSYNSSHDHYVCYSLLTESRDAPTSTSSGLVHASRKTLVLRNVNHNIVSKTTTFTTTRSLLAVCATSILICAVVGISHRALHDAASTSTHRSALLQVRNHIPSSSKYLVSSLLPPPPTGNDDEVNL
jgi:hypothetical protein